MTEKVIKTKEGVVVSNKMARTVVVFVERIIKHPRYSKVIRRGKKFYADCGDKKIEIGQKVKIEETRPMSKLKRWKVVAA